MKNEMKKIYYQVVEKVLPQVYLLYNSFNNKFILLNNVRYEKYKKENILELEQSDPVLYKSLVDNQYICLLYTSFAFRFARYS